MTRETNNLVEKYIDIPDREEKQEITAKDIEFWSGEPPEEVIIATGSVRKALMMVAQMNDFSFKVYDKAGNFLEITGPLELQRYFNDNIYNGNGSLKEKTFLGYLYGLEFYAEPSNGETSSNEDPYQEAVNKVEDLYEIYKGRKVLIVSTDTVDKPSSSKFPLGKPENDFGFPQKEEFNHESGYDEELYLEAVKKYLEAYKMIFYASSEQIIHTNGVAVLNALNGEIVKISKRLIELHIDIDLDSLEEVQIYPDMGGGGVTQQLVEWDDPEAVSSYFDPDLYDILPEEDDVAMRMALMCQISGAPYAIIEVLRLAQEKIVNSRLE
ncbi:hypothetical protein KA111_01575 [Candidatus Woesebacteria bacterium]|nr:hypothetical protein [Candidatus Woesebacteria bacterium]